MEINLEEFKNILGSLIETLETHLEPLSENQIVQVSKYWHDLWQS